MKLLSLRTYLTGLFLLILIIGTGFFCVKKNKASQKTIHLVDSLNREAYHFYYRNIDSILSNAQRAFELAENYPVGRVTALNHLGFHAFMSMDFEQAIKYYTQARYATRNEIESLIAEVGLMKVYQRTSQNKEFYEVRESAMSRMKRINEDLPKLESRWQERFLYGKTDFFIVSSIYYYYLGQEEQAIQEIEQITPEELEKHDIKQWLYYLYMRGSGGLIRGNDVEEIKLKEFDYLIRCLRISKKENFPYFEANSLQGIAELMNLTNAKEILETKRSATLQILMNNYKVDSLNFLPMKLANDGLTLFKSLKDVYQTAGTLRTIASIYIKERMFTTAIDTLNQALGYVNRHHEAFYSCADTLHRLQSYQTESGEAQELIWTLSPNIQTVPEWILRIREQLSLAYSGLGMKPASDYNRNIYLDLMAYTRQDKELENRYEALDKEIQSLNFIIILSFLGLIVLLLLFAMLNRYWKKRHMMQTKMLEETLNLCKNMMSYSTNEIDLENLMMKMANRIEADFHSLFNIEKLEILPYNITEEKEKNNGTKSNSPDYTLILPLNLPGESKPVGILKLYLPRKPHREERILMQVTTPYLAWAISNGNNRLELDEEHRRLVKQEYIYRQHIAEKKRENIVKRTCLQLVWGIIPFIDRAIFEVKQLKSIAPNRTISEKDTKEREDKYHYLSELIEKIISYNKILSEWITLKQGKLKLQIETFELAELFQIISKRIPHFNSNRLTLEVKPTTSKVKADKALTMFMINTLTENARKYTPHGGYVSVEATETEDYVEISVADTGPGISENDINRILNEKIYDATLIGMDSEEKEEIKKKKGSGFGLMNCKGIIDKYKKTGSLFSVCKFGIDSTLGKGSRFFFRLPKGKSYGILMAVILSINLISPQISYAIQKQTEDSLLEKSSQYADNVYYSNINGAYEQAIFYADSALNLLNAHYEMMKGGNTDTIPRLQLYGNGLGNEIRWFEEGFDTDYYIILDIRNEVAVASLALHQWENYKFNNEAYARLYKLVSKDHTLEDYCRQMQQTASSRMVGIGLCVLFGAIFIGAYYWLYVRRRYMFRLRLEQVFAVNHVAFEASLQEKKSLERNDYLPKQHIPFAILEAIWNDINDLFNVKELALLISNGTARVEEWNYTIYPPTLDDERKEIVLKKINACANEKKELQDSDLILPLIHEVGNGEAAECIGAIAICRKDGEESENDRVFGRLVAGFISIVIMDTILRPAIFQEDIDDILDESHKAKHEETLLHVQNMVLDNCLSTIKHETAYYPSKIYYILKHLIQDEDVISKEQTSIHEMEELISYYRDVFTLLAQCAARQLQEVTFKRSTFEVEKLTKYIQEYFKKKMQRANSCQRDDSNALGLSLEIEAKPNIMLTGDYNELSFLLENLVDEALKYDMPGILSLKISNVIIQDKAFVRFDFEDQRRTLSPEDLADLFSADRLSIRHENPNFLKESLDENYLICKQIIREHDEYMGHPGLRINAEPINGKKGLLVWFTVPKGKNRG